MPLIGLMLLTSCATENSGACPMIKTYTPEEQDKAGIELSRLPQSSELRIFMNDYGLLRQEARDCN